MNTQEALRFLGTHEQEERPWGNFERLVHNEEVTVKIITVNEGQSISLQTHEHRDEFWRILTGTGTIHIDGIDYEGKVGDSFFCQRGLKHRVTGGPGGTVFLEIAFGKFDEGDIVRYEDVYGRVKE